jgi:hypothetical protein
LILLTGCSLINPHVTGDETLRLTQATSEVKFYGDLPKAIDYADSLRRSYYDAVGEQSLARNGMAGALVGLSAAALSAAITQAKVETLVADLAITGAGIAGAGMLLTSSDRQRVYLSGSQAIGCAILSMRPFLITEPDYQSFKAAASRLPGAIVKLETDVLELQGLVAQFPADPLAAEAQATIAVSQSLLARARAAAAATDNAVLQIETAGRTLQTAVDSIKDKVSVEITKTEPDLQSILGVANGLGGIQKRLTPAIATTAPAGGAGKKGFVPQSLQASRLRQPIAKARLDSIALAEDLGRVEAVLQRIGPGSDAAKLLSVCKPDTLSTEYAVEPAAIQFQAGAAAVQPVSLQGGQPPYVIALLEDPVDGLTVRQLPPFGPTATVAFNGKAPSGTYHLWVNANNGQARIVPITIIGTAPPVAAPPAPKPAEPKPEAPRPGVEGDLASLDREKIQRVLCTAAGGTFDDATRSAIAEFRQTEGSTASGPLTQAEIKTLLGMQDCPPDRRSYFERKILDSAEAVRKLQRAIGMAAPSGVLDTATREKIAEFQRTNNLSPTDGLVRPDLMERLGLSSG